MDQFIYKSDFNENLLNLFKQNLFETSWDSSKNIADPSESYHKFLEIFSTLYKNYFPLTKVTLKPKRKKSPWITNGIANLSKRKQKLYENFFKRTPENKETYKAYKNLFEIIKRRSKKKFYSAKLIKFQGDTKKTWHIMKKLIGKSGIDKLSFPQKIVINKTEIVGETKIANEFNKFFKNILAQKIPQPLKRFESYMDRVNSEMKTNALLSVN